MSSKTKVIWAEPVANLAVELRAEAEKLRGWNDATRADLFDAVAVRVDAALEEGASKTWMPVAAVASLLGKHPETIRVRCRKHLSGKGLARKEGGDWFVHADALAA